MTRKKAFLSMVDWDKFKKWANHNQHLLICVEECTSESDFRTYITPTGQVYQILLNTDKQLIGATQMEGLE